jgi:hypothetical protein
MGKTLGHFQKNYGLEVLNYPPQVLNYPLMFWIICLCSELSAYVLNYPLVFWIIRLCSELSACVLKYLPMFWIIIMQVTLKIRNLLSLFDIRHIWNSI